MYATFCISAFVVCTCMTGWVSHVRREGGARVKIVPRLLLEGWTMVDFQEVFASEASMTQVAEFVVKSLQVSEGGFL